MKQFNLIFIFALFSTICGCATIISGGSQNVNVQAIDNNSHAVLADASCLVTDGRGNTYAVNSNPGAVTIPNGYGALTVNCTKHGYHQTKVGYGQSFNAWTIANVIFWPGVLVDAATGAAVKYPSHITVIMNKNSQKATR